MLDSQQNTISEATKALGTILWSLFENWPESVPLKELIEENGDTVIGAVAILLGLGIVRIDGGHNLIPASRNANFVVGSLSKLLTSPSRGSGEEEITTEYLRRLTRGLEAVRQSREDVDHEPIHKRRIVNVAIKSRKTRRWRKRDVYLHVLHPQWQSYHLIGLSHKDGVESDEDLARKALRRIGLEPNQYRFDEGFRPEEIELTLLSENSGAICRYSYKLMTIKKVSKRIKLGDAFRWFTWDEIQERVSDENEKIMYSTPIVLQDYLDNIPLNAPRTDDTRPKMTKLPEIANRVSLVQIVLFVGVLLISGTIWILLTNEALLFRLGAIGSIIGAFFTVYRLIERR